MKIPGKHEIIGVRGGHLPGERTGVYKHISYPVQLFWLHVSLQEQRFFSGSPICLSGPTLSGAHP